jgi:hypothetical protein
VSIPRYISTVVDGVEQQRAGMMVLLSLIVDSTSFSIAPYRQACY